MYKTRTFLGKPFYHYELFQMDIEDNLPQILSKTNGEKINILVVGAWRGDEIQSFLKYPNIHIWAFEPNPTNFNYLQKRYGTNPNVTCLNIACGAEDGTLPLYEANITGNDSLLAIQDTAHIQTKKVHTVKVKKLDSIPELKDIMIDMLWVDVQGYELPVLQGATNMLPHIQSMFLEINEDERTYVGATLSGSLGNFLTEHGFYNAHQENDEANGGGSGFFLNKNIKTNFFTDTVTLEKRVSASLEMRRKKIGLSKNPLYRWSQILPTPLKVWIKKILHI